MRTVLQFRNLVRILVAGALLCCPFPALPDEDAQPLALERWLVLGPLPAPLPAFHLEEAGKFSLKDLLSSEALPAREQRPRAGGPVWWNGEEIPWREERGAEVKLRGDARAHEAYLAAYLAVERFSPLEIVVRSHHLLRLFVDGEEVATKDAATAEQKASGGKGHGKDKPGKPEPGEARAKLHLEPGVHLLLVRALRDPAAAHPWSVAAELLADDLPPQVRSGPEHPLELAQVLDVPQPDGVDVSPDGEMVAVRLRRIRPGTDDGESWLEVRRTADGTLERTYRGMTLSNVDWAPHGRRLSYVTRDGDKADLWLADLDSGATRPILEQVEHLGSYVWAPDGRSVIYAVTDKPEKDETGIQHLWGLRDRQAGMRERSNLYQVFVEGGARRRLTAGGLGTSAADLSADGRRLLFTRTLDDYENRPYVRSEIHVLDLESLEVELVHPGHWLHAASFSPDGRRLLVRGGPSAFDAVGKTVPEEAVPNDYDDQLFLLDLASGEVTPLTRDFDPSISRAVWHREDGRIYLSAVDGPRQRLYRLEPETGRFTALETGVEVVDGWDLSERATTVVLTGSDATRPPRVMALDVGGGGAREILAPGADAFEDVVLGEVKEWSFVSRRGATIEGRVYYPPGFDAAQRYPAIVYYYGGTFPTVRDFGGRYPKNWWAANGYVVYVLQPSGAVGYGQEFSALHVNDWGGIAGDDILEGLDRFLEAHPFVDGERVGCIGASYGGFMTQYLLTRSDRFAAGVSHAGISSLGSYWGEGYWGYAYSAVATADSFPWNRGDVYVGHSPLFNAHRIHTPLLLLHGADDTNVPPGESEQLYTALKLLGRPVEYVRIEGQNHHILKHDQRVLWSKTIVAWFDRWLKDQPAWWDHLYPGPAGKDD